MENHNLHTIIEQFTLNIDTSQNVDQLIMGYNAEREPIFNLEEGGSYYDNY